MTRTSLCTLIILGLGGVALAQEKAAPPQPQGGMPDMTKMGPMSRKVTKEDKKGIEELYKSMQAAWKGGDINALADLVDFPVIMLSDDSKGEAKYFSATREQWIEMMKPMMNMPKDIKWQHKHTAHFLSDSLAAVIEETSMTMGKTKGKWKGLAVVTLRDGRWKFKEMAEAGWGDMKPPAGASAAALPARK
jgi:hypothetical protein